VPALTLTALQHIPIIRHGDNLADIIVDALEENKILLEEKDILVIAQKIVRKPRDAPSILQR
jgi:coenzyme F420-0:L-glutamate ligase/coenzyme F420-1:gamma-L-glutamate ligase